MNSQIQLWQYAPGGVLSFDGSVQLSGIDRTRYAFRRQGEIATLTCEHYTFENQPRVTLFLSRGVVFNGPRGERRAAADDIELIKTVALEGMPMIGRAVDFQ